METGGSLMLAPEAAYPEIYAHLEWLIQGSKYFGRDGALRLVKRKLSHDFVALPPRVDVLMLAAAVYDCAAEFAQAKSRTCRLCEWPLWEARVSWCLRQAMKCSDEALQYAGTVGKFSLWQLSVRQSVLRRLAWHANGTHTQDLLMLANSCVDEAFTRLPDMSLYERGVLLIGKADILVQIKSGVGDGLEMQKILDDIDAISSAVARSSLLQASRICRWYSIILKRDARFSEYLDARSRAMVFSRMADVPDEIFKAGAL